MKDSIHKYFRVGLISFMAFPEIQRGADPAAVIDEIARDDYFDIVEISHMDEAARKAAKKTLETAHMGACFGAQPMLLQSGLNPNHLDETEREKAQRLLFQAVDEASDLGCEGIAFLSGKWAKEQRGAAFTQLLKTTRSVCDYAKAKGLFVELEVFDFDIAKSALIGPAPLAAEFAAQMRQTHSNFGLMIDLSHIPMTYETTEFVVRVLRPYITHFHIGNTVCCDPMALGYGDEHQRFGFPGGSNDVPQVQEFLQVLKGEGFFNAAKPYILSFEVKPWQDEDARLVLAGAKRVLNRAWALLED